MDKPSHTWVTGVESKAAPVIEATPPSVAAKLDAEKILHQLKMICDFDDMELLTEPGRDIWNQCKETIDQLCVRHSRIVHGELLNQKP